MADYIIEPLDPDQHDRAAFSCGVEALDRYLKQQARREVERDIARVFVLRPRDSSAILGYYTLSMTSLEPTNLPPDLARRMPRYPTLPAILIGRLAVDQRYLGQGMGRRLLFSALRRSLRLRAEIGCIAVVVDAKDTAARAFYEQYDFLRFTNDAYRLFLPMKTTEQLFEK